MIRGKTVRFDITSASLVRIASAVGAVWLLTQLWDVVLLIVMALIVAGTLSPFVTRFESRLSRGGAVTAVLLTLFAGVGLLAFVTLPALVSQAAEFVRASPDLYHQAVERLAHVPGLSSIRKASDVPVSDLLSKHGGQLLSASTAFAAIVGYAATALVLSVYFLADPVHAKGVLYVLIPRAYHVRTARILLNLETIVGGYMRGQVITSAAMTLYVFLLLLACGVSNPLPLAVFAGLADVIPMVGGVLSLTPAVLAAIPEGWGVVAVVAGAIIAYQEFENRVLAPRIYGRTLRMSPAAVLIALVIGGKLMGIVGALLALPIASALLMMIEELQVELPGRVGTTNGDEMKTAEALYARKSAEMPTDQAPAVAESIAAAHMAEHPKEG